MTVIDVILSAKQKRGISSAEFSRRTGIGYQSLVATFDGRRRRLTAPELIALCRELELDLSDFPDELASKEED